MAGFDPTTAITIGGKNVWDEGTEEIFARSSGEATRHLRCAWADRFDVIKALRGGASQVGAVVIFGAAAQYPDANGLFIDDIRIEGDGKKSVGGNGMVAYQWALLAARYTSLNFGDSQQSTQWAVNFGNEVIAFPRETLKFSDGTAMDQGMAVKIPVASLSKGLTGVPSIPVTKILTATKSPLNSVAVSIIGGSVTTFNGSGIPTGTTPGDTFVAAAKTLLFNGGRSLSRYTPDKGWNYDVEYEFLYRSIPWDKFIKSDGTYMTVQRRDGSALLDTSDLNALLNPTTIFGA